MTTPFAKETIPANIEKEMRQSYLDYAMSVIVGRALPDVRDGLKPVHRRVLYAMSELGNDWNKAYKKSARVVGDVIGKYHPHSDAAAYDTIVRMAQNFSLRYMLVDGQGNFGSVDGDSPAAMRYTEIRLARIAHELLADLDKETVDFGPNYDETETQPLVLPTRVPNLLCNGSSGIAVGMATNIPPHNLGETIATCLALLDDPDLTVEALMHLLPGPDFPTAGIINGSGGIREAYETGRGRIEIRARTAIETNPTGREIIVVHELPYQVNKARLLEKIAELVKSKSLTGIAALRDESDKAGMRMVIEVKRGEPAEVVLNNLYKRTQLQTVFGINMVALSNNQPKLFNLKQILAEFLKHRREVVTRRTLFEFAKAANRAHILEGLAVALTNIDAIIALIKASPTPAAAKQQLLDTAWNSGSVATMLARSDGEITRPKWLASHYGAKADGYHLSPYQAQAILELRLDRLTGLEQNKIHKEYEEIIVELLRLLTILREPEQLMAVIRTELNEIRARYDDPRRTEIIASQADLSIEDLIPDETLVVTLSNAGYAKSQPIADYRAQKRGGKGKLATRTKQEDFVRQMFIANSHATILCFSNLGKVYWLRAFQFPQTGRHARGRPLVNLLPLDDDEQVTAILPLVDAGDDKTEAGATHATAGKNLLMVTRRGTIKKCDLAAFSHARPSGLRALHLDAGDHLVAVAVTDGQADILLLSDAGKATRFAEQDVRVMGRAARGIRGIRLAADEQVIAALVLAPTADEAPPEPTILLGTTNGYGKRTDAAEFPRKRRGGKGIIAIKTSTRNGRVVSARLVAATDDVLLITDGGLLIRTRVDEISVQGRNTQGVRLIALNAEERLVGISTVLDSDTTDPTPVRPSEPPSVTPSDPPDASG